MVGGGDRGETIPELVVWNREATACRMAACGSKTTVSCRNQHNRNDELAYT